MTKRKSPEFDYASHPEGTFDNPYSEDDHHRQSIAGNPTEQLDDQSVELQVPPKPLEQIQAENEARMREYDAMKADLESRNWPPGRIAQKLDAEFPDLRTAERIEELAVQEDASARRTATSEGVRKKKHIRKYYGPRDTGPPPHIAEDVRNAQGFTDT